jgi:hypothetical protein
MTRIWTVALAAGSLLVPCAATHAQVNCPEGRAANGQCVNPLMAAAIREAAILFSQARISSTAYPVLPTGDSSYRYPHNIIRVPQIVNTTGTAAPTRTPTPPPPVP